EIGRGTSTFDGLALAGAIASHLHEKCQAFVLFATHYFELTAFPATHHAAINVHVDVAEAGHDIVFLHAISPGPASRSYGIQVARLAGMPAAVIQQARQTLQTLEAQQTEQQQQIDLFAAPRHVETVELPAIQRELERAVEALEPDQLTPLQALEAVYALKKMVG
ncbi:MAG: DNA mismatch repair protein MutS, partial [Brachymonas sp.]|nr:DNA mismatch repair protein MutS [Brachymonas sp.]